VVGLDTTKEDEITSVLVTTEEADAVAGKISTSSPIGRALLGKEVGDAVRVQLPGGFRELEILKLTTIHEAAD
jgi:transcription elongation factor GreA